MVINLLINYLKKRWLLLLLISANFLTNSTQAYDGLPLYYWQEKFVNFGDYLSLVLVERIVGSPIRSVEKNSINSLKEPKLLAIGSILTFARNNDIIWGSGANGKWLDLKYYKFANLDIRAVRGPLTRNFLITNFSLNCPEVYGDPALLFPYFFPEFKRKEKPSYDYVIIPHYSEQFLFPKFLTSAIVYPTEPWDMVIQKILDSKLVISSSLHGIIIAEAFGIPARLLRVTDKEPLFKYQDYYFGTNRFDFRYATSIEEAIKMGGEKPCICNLEKLYSTFPFEYWPKNNFQFPNFDERKS